MKFVIKNKTFIESFEQGAFASLTDGAQTDASARALLLKSSKVSIDENTFSVESSVDMVSSKFEIQVKKENFIICQANGSALVPSKELLKWLQAQNPEAQIEFSLNRLNIPEIIRMLDGSDSDKYLIKKIGSATFIARNPGSTNSKWELDVYDSGYISNIDYNDSGNSVLETSVAAITDAMSKVVFCASSKDTEHVYDNISVQSYDGVACLATSDNQRCMIFRAKDLKFSVADEKLLIPIASFTKVVGLCGKKASMALSVKDGRFLFVKSGNLLVRISMPSNEASKKFLPIDRLLNEKYAQVASVSATSVETAIDTASLVNKFSGMFDFDKESGVFTVTAISEEGKYKPSISKNKSDGILVSTRKVLPLNYIADFIKHIKPENVNFAMSSGQKAFRLSGEDDSISYIIRVQTGKKAYGAAVQSAQSAQAAQASDAKAKAKVAAQVASD